MILRQFCVRHGRAFVARSASRCQSASYATSLSANDRRLRPSTGDKVAQQAIPGHPDQPSSILDTTGLPPTARTRSIQENLDAITASLQSVQTDVNVQVAARTGAVTANIKALVPDASPEDSIPKLPFSLEQYQKQIVKQKIQSLTGTKQSFVYDPMRIVEKPPTPEQVDLPTLLANQTHLGHHTSLWNPSNSSYIYGIREGIHIISLDTTYAYLQRASKVVHAIAKAGGIILFVGTRKGQTDIVTRAAERAGAYHIFDRWVPGTLTNGQQLLGDCAVKVVDMHDNEVATYKEMLGSGKTPSLRPDLVVCLNPLENEVCLHECGLNTVPTIGVIDTDANPSWVTYPIPANDDSLRSIALIAGVLSQAAAQGNRDRLAAAKDGVLTYNTRNTEQWLKHAEMLNSTEVSEMTVEED